ncbi:hypothetical protein SARC_03777 [Sphaeroforma arctica JP610]|uniref:Uncharacterized protein n=1 Tax=Sphaeroforma arctica JP610 TaxID=667725 RepID=A0A0L0G4Y9_9EUKA|nr:hypothetical protein SARC_03777 [Sphaeroforma arctica JP610]KNC83989.1 hypothetical protein SARC_03777 [Sphaeroforma arctica JP610]|eukprot:XP_014157891.1 hypothetical protein SARC_03777 [Sphaeroforma arctica JP610]
MLVTPRRSAKSKNLYCTNYDRGDEKDKGKEDGNRKSKSDDTDDSLLRRGLDLRGDEGNSIEDNEKGDKGKGENLNSLKYPMKN